MLYITLNYTRSKAVNEVIKNKKGIIDEAKKILDKLDNVDKLKRKLTKKEEKM